MPWKDGINVIPFTIYDGSGNLVAKVDNDGFTIYGTGSYVGALINMGLATGAPTITFQPPPIVNHPYTPGSLTVRSDAVEGPSVDIASPKETGKQISTFTIYGEGNSSHPPRINVATDFLTLAGVILDECDIKNDGWSQGRGFRGGCFLSSDSSSIGTTETSVNFTGTSVPIFRNNRVYRVDFSGVLACSGTTGVIMRVRKGQTAAGALIYDLGVVPAGGGFTPPPPSIYFANTTGSDITSNICATLQTGSGTAQWLANGNRPSGFSIWDAGDANQMNGIAPFGFIT